ncbi:MAG: hypothetical protein WAU60_13175 [Candidatus Competibacter denitrificans]
MAELRTFAVVALGFERVKSNYGASVSTSNRTTRRCSRLNSTPISDSPV